MDVWEVPQSSRSGLDRGYLMEVGPRAGRRLDRSLDRGQLVLGLGPDAVTLVEATQLARRREPRQALIEASRSARSPERT